MTFTPHPPDPRDARLEELLALGASRAVGSSPEPNLEEASTLRRGVIREDREATNRRARRRRGRRSRRDLERRRRLSLKWQAEGSDTTELPPAFDARARGRAERIMLDEAGREALEALCVCLPNAQALRLISAAVVALPFVQVGKASAIRRADVAAAPELGKAIGHAGVREVLAAEEALHQVAPSLWFRRLVSAAVGLWTLRRKLHASARRAWRGGVYAVEGFAQGALAWLVPNPGRAPLSRAALWGPDGPFMLLGRSSSRLGREDGVSGLGLFKRWQPPVSKARFRGKGRTVTLPGGGQRFERYALAQHRYDAAMCGRTALSAARRGNDVALAVVRIAAPHLLPQGVADELDAVADPSTAPESTAPAAPWTPATDEPRQPPPERPPDRP